MDWQKIIFEELRRYDSGCDITASINGGSAGCFSIG
jgi:hypothetical protein